MASKEINYGLLQSARKPKTLDGTPLSPRDTKRQSLTRKVEPKPPVTITSPGAEPKKPSPQTTPKAPKVTPLKIPTSPPPAWVDQPSSTRKVMKDKIAHEVRKTLEDPRIDPHAEFVKYVALQHWFNDL